MPCNGFNHPPDCNCGWGGVYYASDGLHGERSLAQRAAAWPMAPGSFINYNAHCPVCGAAVFFYRSPEGGRVFFDALGRPWPKHPCTDKGERVSEPSSAFWWAQGVLASVPLLKDPRALPNNAGFQAGLEQVLTRGVEHGRAERVVAWWVCFLPREAVGKHPLEFGQPGR